MREHLEKDHFGTVNTVYSDLRKELVAASLAAAGYDADRIFITRRLTSPNSAGKEITAVEVKVSDDKRDPDIFIATNRPGMYDSLPEGLFHTSITQGSHSKEKILEEIRLHRQEEFYVRRFFSLYETEIERMRVDIQTVELSYDKPYRHSAFVSTLVPFWPVIKLMDLSSAIMFVRLIPFIHRIRDSFERTAEAMTMILGDKTEICLVEDRALPRMTFKKLGTSRLGVDMLLDGTYRGVVPAVRITVTPGQEREKEYVPGRRFRQIAESLAGIFIPARFPASVTVSSGSVDGHFTVGDRNRPCILGINTSLTPTNHESQKQ